MSIQEAEAQIRKIDEEIRQLEQKDTPDVDFETIKDELEKARHKIMTKAYANLSTFFIYDVLYSIMLILWSNNPQLNIYYHIYRCMNCKS